MKIKHKKKPIEDCMFENVILDIHSLLWTMYGTIVYYSLVHEFTIFEYEARNTNNL